MSDKSKYVIIGNGTAAVGAVEGIRSVDKNGTVTVISKEPYKSYCRPLISYLLEGKTDTQKMQYRDDDFYIQNNCNLLLGESAENINQESKTVNLASGNSLKYDKLLIASGASSFVPEFEGIETVSQKFSFMTLGDALAIEKAVTEKSRVLIIGAGLIGLKCAEGLINKVGSITVCDLAPRVLSSILDDESAKTVGEHLENNGIKLLLGDTAVKFNKDCAFMKSGKKIEFDILIIAVGVKPNIDIFKNAGGQCGKGITVDCEMRTSIPDVFAAGDCTESIDITSEIVKIMALMPNAFMQGKCAGINMAGGKSDFSNAIPMNSIGLLGLHVMSAGSYIGEEDTVKSENGIKKFYIKDGLLKGFIIINDTARAGIYTSMIRNKIPVDSVDFDSLKQIPTLYSFGEDYCKAKLGGVV